MSFRGEICCSGAAAWTSNLLKWSPQSRGGGEPKKKKKALTRSWKIYESEMWGRDLGSSTYPFCLVMEMWHGGVNPYKPTGSAGGTKNSSLWGEWSKTKSSNTLLQQKEKNRRYNKNPRHEPKKLGSWFDLATLEFEKQFENLVFWHHRPLSWGTEATRPGGKQTPCPPSPMWHSPAPPQGGVPPTSSVGGDGQTSRRRHNQTPEHLSWCGGPAAPPSRRSSSLCLFGWGWPPFTVL